MSEQPKNRTTVDIYGQQYVIVGTEPTSHIRLVASMVDEKMREINSMNPSLDTTKLAVLTSVNTVHEYLKLKDQVEQLEKELKRIKD
ncbi:cell division protein ZapA [Bacillus coahuilensis m2-6]|uniref:Cell division protein ZapA n=1 Tax=Bacillus coahuilensis p1.1.43 TaxID=1150625 RepID=A0A147K6U9_9BACI|nr:cell division protein ZapA [Bacillus coahuilensis]KUP05755.1 cell division protein ZapA [Bacillus coahuilensis p1.1.43]KUP06790.1 cell division protein ZapA [Bacillus coahuilensis m2-6]